MDPRAFCQADGAAGRRPSRLGTSLCGLIVLVLSLGGLPAKAETVDLLAGPAGGTYERIARGMAERLLSDGESDGEAGAVELVIEPSGGSADNFRRLAAGEARFAFAQQDTVSELLLKGVKGASSVRVVGRLFFDSLHILLRSPVHVEQAGELRYLRIWPGEKGSGSRTTAVHFLESVGVPLTSLAKEPPTLRALLGERAPNGAPATEELGVRELPQLFGENALDVAMVVTTPGSDAICEAIKSRRFRLHPLDYRTLRILTNEGDTAPFRRQIAIATIPAGTYTSQDDAIPTVAVPVLLLAREGEDPAVARALLDAARAEWQRLTREPGPAGCRIPAIHPAAGSLRDSNLTLLDGFDDPFPWRRRLGPWLTPALLVLLPLLLMLWLWRSGIYREVWRVLSEDRFALEILAVLVVGVLLVTFLTYLFEHRTNENFSTPWESFWSITVYLFSGLEDRTPYTTAGRMVAALGLLLGPLLFAFLTGWLARFFIRWERRMPQNLTGHTLIVNWNERAIRIVRELHHPVVSDRRVIVVLTDDDTLTVRRLKDRGLGAEEVFEDLYITVGDPGAERALLNANAQDAKTIVILAGDEPASSGRDGGRRVSADERSVRTLVMLRRIARREGARLHVIVELADSANEPVVEEIAQDFPGLVEYVSGLQVRTCLLAQAALSEGVTEFYRDLLRVTGDTNEIYIRPLPPEAVGRDFRELSAELTAEGGDNPIIPVGVQREVDGRLRTFGNPRSGESAATIAAGDRLVVMAHEPPGEIVLEARPGASGRARSG